MEKIIKIEKVDDNSGLGYLFTTDQQVISILIDNGSSCCESWGMICTEDDIEYFINAEILSLSVVDEQSFKRPLLLSYMSYSGLYCMFFNIETNKGVLQFVTYNQHNGYYGHSVVIKSNQLNHQEVL